MADNYSFYDNESLVDKENRVEGRCLQKLHDKLIQSNNESPKTRSIKRQATSQTQHDSENEESILFVDNESNLFTTVKKNQNYQKRKIQRGEQQRINNVDQLDESYNNDKLRKTNNYRIYSRRTKTKEGVDDSSHHTKALGFDYWWINNDDDLIGITKDLSLYVYLCDIRHYPEYIDSIKLNPMLPIHLPPQHVVVLKFVPNNYFFVDIEKDLGGKC
ncbi:unnamed protein product [Rotaria sp. Silwood1]|nr:unnamed protein product [Rotaria sp. Silwood1]CAF4564901.1 unnamed protein product [Rotaria sp. Silwood1]CAF4571460.1 unnamed protein product [Rotaria sp. Silwood1]